MQSLTRLLSTTLTIQTPFRTAPAFLQQLRGKTKVVEKPKPGAGQQFRRTVHFPEKYTVEPLKITHLAGRDPVSGRLVAKGIGGGIKQQYRWVKWVRDGPTEGAQEELVLEVLRDGCRTAKVALVAVGDELKYILATENMKAGDILKTSRFIPRIPGKFTYCYSSGVLNVF